MTQHKQTKRRFSPEFKLEAIEQVVKYQQRVDVKRIHLRSRVRALHLQSRGSAGSRMLSLLLCQEGYRGSKEESLASANLLKRGFNQAAPNRVWCDDISCNRIQGG